MASDLVLLDGAVHTVDPEDAVVEAVAVEGGRIAAVGRSADLRQLIGRGTRVLSLEGRTVLPGFQDAHVHLAHGGIAGLRCDLYSCNAPAVYEAAIRAYAESHPEETWIVGGGWSMDDFGGPMPTRALLDRIVPDRPVYLETRDAHTAWVNTRALELAGVDTTTADPAGGIIDRDASGAPSGTLQEHAMRLVSRLLPPPDPAAWERAVLLAQAEVHALGVTACQEANLTPDLDGPYRAVAARGDLTLRLEGNLDWDDTRGEEQLEELLARRAHGTVGRLHIRGAKIFQDGVVESHTAAMLDSYLDGSGHPTGSSGLSLLAPEWLAHVVALLDGHGFQVHVHAIGDRAVRESLDALAHAVSVNGPRDARHHLAHVQFVHEDDLPRFRALGVVANVTPLWAVMSGYVRELTLPFVSPRAAATIYPFGSLARAGATLAVGSDWTVSSPDPLLQLQVAVHRTPPGHRDDEPLLPDERLSLDDAIRAATLGSASVNHLDSLTGSLEAGKLADLVVLDRDLRDRGAGEIADARVEVTLVEGECVYARPGGIWE